MSFSGSSRSCAASNSSRATAATTTTSASAKAETSSFWKILRRVVLRARLENRPDLLMRIFDPQCSESFANCGGMMSEVVNHRHSTRDAAQFHSPLHATETYRTQTEFVYSKDRSVWRRDNRQRVANIEFAGHVQVKFETGNFELCRCRSITDIECGDGVVLAQAQIVSPGKTSRPAKARGCRRRRFLKAGHSAAPGG